MSRFPQIKDFVLHCTGCLHWQIDAPPRAVRELGGSQPTLWAFAEAHAKHLEDCPGGTTGRVKVQGRWVERPTMSDGQQTQGLLEATPLPPWWVWR